MNETKDGVHTDAHGVNRCWWCVGDALYETYHDTQWGFPIFDDNRLFEDLCLDGFQAGLSWRTILHRRKGFRKAFAGFDPKKVAAFDEKDVRRLLKDEGIIRNNLKIRAAINNAGKFLTLAETHGSYNNFLQQFKPKRKIVYKTIENMPAITSDSEALSKELKNLGFKFVGPTTCYAHMQSLGIVNDHIKSCFRYEEIEKMSV